MLKQLLLVLTLVSMTAGVIARGNAAEAGMAPQASNERGIKVTVTPRNLSSFAKTWDFEVVLETHTQSLGDDMVKSSTLVEGGKQHVPLSWEGAPPGGHHRKGLLHFKAITPQPPSVGLQIRLTGEAAPRNFQWFLKGARNGK